MAGGPEQIPGEDRSNKRNYSWSEVDTGIWKEAGKLTTADIYLHSGNSTSRPIAAFHQGGMDSTKLCTGRADMQYHLAILQPPTTTIWPSPSVPVCRQPLGTYNSSVWTYPTTNE